MRHTRRRILTSATATLATVAAGSGIRAKSIRKPVKAPSVDQRPNIVLIVADDMRATDWQALPKTRSALAGATEFPNYFCQFPVCSPSRTTLLTGLLAHNHGVLLNVGPADLAGYSAFARHGMERRSLPVLLQKSGYTTALVGKFMHGYDSSARQPDGWSRWVARGTGGYINFDLVVDSEVQRYNHGEYATDVLAEFANEFVSTAPEDRPFFLYFSPTAPHEPYQPAPRHLNRFTRNMVERDASFNEEDVSDKPSGIASLPVLTQEQIDQVDATERVRLQLLSATDEAVAGLVKALRSARKLDKTVIMFVSDNGYMMGQHRIFGTKGQPYDQAIRVPMLAFGPGFKEGIDKRIVVNCDVAPTIAELAGISLKRIDGVSLLSRIRRDCALLQLASNEYRDGGFGLRTNQWLYFEYESGDHEFYDLRNDPLELFNLLGPSAGPTPVIPAELPGPAQLAAKLASLRRCRGSRCVSVAGS